MFGLGIHTLYNVIDMIFIGQLGGNAIAGVAFNMPIFFLMLGLTMGLGSGVTASIARFIGDEDKKVRTTVQSMLAMAGGIAIVFTILGIYYGEKILIALGAEGEILVLAWEYLSMIVLGLPFMVFSDFLDLFLRVRVI